MWKHQRARRYQLGCAACKLGIGRELGRTNGTGKTQDSPLPAANGIGETQDISLPWTNGTGKTQDSPLPWANGIGKTQDIPSPWANGTGKKRDFSCYQGRKENWTGGMQVAQHVTR